MIYNHFLCKCRSISQFLHVSSIMCKKPLRGFYLITTRRYIAALVIIYNNVMINIIYTHFNIKIEFTLPGYAA